MKNIAKFSHLKFYFFSAVGHMHKQNLKELDFQFRRVNLKIKGDQEDEKRNKFKYRGKVNK